MGTQYNFAAGLPKFQASPFPARCDFPYIASRAGEPNSGKTLETLHHG